MKKAAFFITVTLAVLHCKSAACQANLQTQISDIAKGIHGNVGAYLSLIETGESINLNGQKHFPMQSVYKFPITIAVLNAIDKGHLKPNQIVDARKVDFIPGNGHSPLRDKYPNGTKISISDLIRYSICESDGSASDILCRTIGGINNANSYIHSLGIKDIQLAITEKAQVIHDEVQYQNWSTPEAMGHLFEVFFKQSLLKPDSKALLLKDLTESSPGANRIKGLLPKGTKVAHKTGTSGTRLNGVTAATNDAGIITLPNGRHLVVVVYVSDCADSEQKREAAIAQIAKAAYDHFAK